MSKGSNGEKRPKDVSQLAKLMVEQAAYEWLFKES